MPKTLSTMALVLLLAACGSSPITTSEPQTSANTEGVEPGDLSVDFVQDGERIGSLFVRANSTAPDLVPFLIEMPYIGEGYRLDAITLDFTGEGVMPLIMLEPAPGTLTENVTFSRIDSTVRLAIPDTGKHGDGTILLNMLASRAAFGASGIRLHANLAFGSGDAVADVVIELAP